MADYLSQCPPTFLVEAYGTIRCHPGLGISMLICPCLQRLHQLTAEPSSTILCFNDHAKHPGRTVASLFDVKLTQPHRADHLTARIDRHPGDRKIITTCLAPGDIDPPFQLLGFGWMPPLSPTKLTNDWNEISVICQEFY